MNIFISLLIVNIPEGTKGIKYTNKGNNYIVGVPNKSSCNAVDSTSSISGLLVIPRKHNGKEITEIAPHAFIDCNLITEVQIYARIRIIGRAAFDHCSSLNKINIPSSVEILSTYSIICNDIINGNETPEGILEVIFEAGSHLKQISDQAIGYRDYVKIYICDKFDDSLIQFTSPAFSHGSISVYSPFEGTTFCGFQTTQYQHFLCSYFNTIYPTFSKKFYFIKLTILIIIFIINK